MMGTARSTALRSLGALLVLAVTFYFVDLHQVIRRLTRLDPLWVGLGIVLSATNYVLLARRWQLVASRLGAPLTSTRALAEYFLAGFANQALPTGLAGAALRAVRHARREGADGSSVGAGRALTIVILERIAGLVVLALVVLIGALVLIPSQPVLSCIAAGTVVGLTAVSLAVLLLAARRSSLGTSGFVSQAKQALLRERVWIHHLLASTGSVLLLCLGFYCAARAADVDVSLARALVVTPIILASMVIPLAVAGWGIREAAAAALFAALGLDAGSGVVVSIAFGLISLVASLPGVIVWLAPERGSGISAPRI